MSHLGEVLNKSKKDTKDTIPEEFSSQILLNKSLHEQNDYLVKALSQPSFKWLSDFVDKIVKPHA